MIEGSKIKISVIIPLYNKEISISKTIDSVLSQSFTDFELVIVNDGSTDESLRVVRQYCNPKVRIFSKRNGGVSSARNFGISKARYEYVAFLDADDHWDNNYLHQMSLLINKYPSAIMFYCPFKSIDKKGNHKSSVILDKSDAFNGLIPIFKFPPRHWPSSSSTIIKKTDETLFFNEQLMKGEDLDYWIRTALRGEVAYINTPMAYYNLSAENRAMSLKTEKSRSLVWNLAKYKDDEVINPDLRVYLDRIRIARIEDFLCGEKIEIEEIDSLIDDLRFTYNNLFWKLLKFVPSWLQGPVFKIQKRLRKVFLYPRSSAGNNKIFLLSKSKNSVDRIYETKQVPY